jgi:hypothetical protein
MNDGYFSELIRAWRPLLGAFIGMACGMSMVGTITSTLVPSFLADLKWDQAEFARIGGRFSWRWSSRSSAG